MTKKFYKLSPGPLLGYVVVFSPANWEEIERAYGQTLSDRARKLISIATLYLTLALPIEKNAPKIEGSKPDVLADIEQLIAQAEMLRAKLYSPHYWSEEYHPYDSSPRRLDYRLMGELQLLDDHIHNESSVLRVCLTGLIESGSEVILRARAGDRGLVRQGDAWNAWFVLITLIAEAFKLPFGVRREVYRVSKPEKPKIEPPPFVKLIKALQMIACPDFHVSATEGGLAKAIARARRSIEVPQRLYVAGLVEADALERELLNMFGITSYSQLRARELSPIEQAVKMVTEKHRLGIHPFIPQVS